MKKQVLLIVLLGYSLTAFSQMIEKRSLWVPNQNLRSENPTPPSAGKITEVAGGHANCIDPTQQDEIWKQINQNIDSLQLRSSSTAARGGNPHPQFIWPVQAKAGFNDYGFYTVQYLVDHNQNYPNQLQDYNCGSRTYDGAGFNHAGTDIILWPYAWRRMDEQVMEIVAAAPGVIISKFDGYFDRKCANNGQGVANGVHIRHSDGSIAWYWHFKSGAITSKAIGDSVVAGEFLGTAGSSGSSDWPHVHFQVMDSLGNIIDPWDGSCNSMNPGSSWWQSQQAYTVPSVNRICTKTSAYEYYNCPNPEVTNERDTFYLGDTLAIWLYMRDLVNASTVQINLVNPSGGVPITFNWSSPWATSPTTYLAWYYIVDPWWVQGNWTFEAVYNGTTYSHPFYMTQSAVGLNDDPQKNDLVVYPNPSAGEIFLKGAALSGLRQGVLMNTYGEKLLTFSNEQSTSLRVDVSSLANGSYLLQLETEKGIVYRKVTICR